MEILNKLKKIFCKEKKKKFMECDTLDEFKKTYIKLVKQDLALEDGRTYFEFQDNLAGEMFDNSFRIRFLEENNKEFKKESNLFDLREEARKSYLEDENNGFFKVQDENRIKYSGSDIED